ncbi:MAG TPA: amino acid permease [Gemmatimonadaceae bacterium]|nr:amino acid permease [Gemmatimonadaceae bacterium]
MSERTEAASERAEPALARGLGLTDATLLVVGSMIGSGIFIVSAESSRLVGSPGWLLVAWALGGVMTITGALCCAELAAMMPRVGGQYVFLREAYGPATAFLFGWAMALVMRTGTIAAVAVAFANFTGVLVPWISGTHYLVQPIVLGRYAVSLSTQQALAIASIAVLTWANTRGLRTAKIIQNTFTVAKTAALLGLIVIGLTLGWNARAAAFTSSWWSPAANGWSAAAAQPGLAAAGGLALAMLLGRAMVGPLFAQSAWNDVTFAAGEVRDPRRNLPRSLLIGCGIVVALYLLANLAYVVTLPLAGIQGAPQNRVATAAMQVALGSPGVTLMALAIMISTFGCNNGLILAGARVSYAMARDGLFFERVARLNARRVPAGALVAQAAWAALLVLPRSVSRDAVTGATTFGNVYTQLLEYIVPGELVMFALMAYAVVAMRRRAPAADRPYRTFGYPLTPAIYVALALVLSVDLVYLAPATSGIGYLIIASGLPAYALWRRARGRAPAVAPLSDIAPAD